MQTTIHEAFRHRFGRAPEWLIRSPGRVALLGAHVDIQDGWVMPAAIERAIWLAAAPRTDRRLDLHALDLEDRATVDLDHLPSPVPTRTKPTAHWTDLPAGLARALESAGHTLLGLDAVYGGDLPSGAGVSSSAAVEMAFAVAWRAFVPSLATAADLDLAQAGRRCENDYLDVRSGIMDQIGCLSSRADHLLLVDCRSLAIEPIPCPAETAVVVFDSGVRRRLSDAGGFNDRRAECTEAVAILRRALPEIVNLRDVSTDQLRRHEHRLPDHLRRRARHTVEEIARVPTAADALRAGDLDAFGRAMLDSHRSSRDLFDVSIPELDTLVEAAAVVPGCHGARLMGGGFGGCVAALVDAAVVDTITARVAETFARAYGHPPKSFRSRFTDGARIVEQL
ncbi:MAG: galactokinase [Acidobacteriota bacterium]